MEKQESRDRAMIGGQMSWSDKDGTWEKEADNPHPMGEIFGGRKKSSIT